MLHEPYLPGSYESWSAVTTGSTTTLTATITASANPVPSDSNFTYTVQVDNTGGNTATSITATVTLDASLTYVSASGTGWGFSHAGQTVTCTLSSLAGSTNANAVTITVTAGNAADASVTSGVSAAGGNTNTATGSSTIAVVQPSDTVTIVDNLRVAGATLAAGPNFNYTVQYTNLGTGTISGISVATTLDASLTYVSSSGTGWTIGVVGQVVTATLASLAAGAANPITITVTPGAAGALSTGVSATATNAQTATATATGTSYACTKDATSGIYCPATGTEWANVMTVAGIASGGPSLLYLCQEASGSLAETISGTISLTGIGSPSYQQAETGWTRKFVMAPGGTTAKFFSTSASLPDISTTSVFALAYLTIPSTPAANISVLTLGTTPVKLTVLATNEPRVDSGANSSSAGTGGVAGVLPWGLKSDHTNSVCTGYTLADKMSPTFSASVAGKELIVGPQSGNSAPQATGYLAVFEGSAAELSDATVKVLYQTLGWAPTWS